MIGCHNCVIDFIGSFLNRFWRALGESRVEIALPRCLGRSIPLIVEGVVLRGRFVNETVLENDFVFLYAVLPRLMYWRASKIQIRCHPCKIDSVGIS